MIEREDIPINEALTDHTFSLEELENSKLDTTKTPRETKWNVWGEKSDPIWDGLDIHYIPIGYSEHVSNGTVLNTYHYTRTYIQVLFDKRGDSDRQWGYKTVKAVGTKVIDSIWKAGTHMVKYGTQD